MYVSKRNGNREIVSFDKISKRVRSLGKEHNININFTTLVMKIIEQLYDGINTSLIDELTAEQSASLSTTHPDYTKLASSLVISNLHKKTESSFSDVMNKIYNFKDVNGCHKPLLSDKFITIVNFYSEYFNNIIDFSRDYLIDYFGFKTLEKSYLFKINGVIVDRPQYMWLRVAICIHENNLEKVKETYDLMSLKYFTHATPTLFNAGTPRPQLSSCYLIGMEDDSVDGIFNTLKECANISKWAGGIGLHIHNIRAKGSHIRGTNGTANGIVPMLKVFNNTARYIDQGGGRRNGSFAIYIEPHHADIEEFLEMKKNHGDEEMRARDLFYGLWVSDLFMERVKTNSNWSLFCPDSAPNLSEYYGDLYKQKYEQYERQKLFTKQINARDLWIKILDSQMETGTPYILYKDAANKKSNQNNLGTIKSSNLCVAPETLILTINGQERIEDLKDKEVEVWNGKEFSRTKIIQTSDASELIDVHTSDGLVLTCTKYHKFYIQNKYQKGKNKNEDIINTPLVEVVEAQNLESGMNIIKCEYPIIDNKELILENSYTNGFFSGDGTYTNITNEELKLCSFKCSKNEVYCKRHIFNKKLENCELRTNNMCNAFSYEKKPHVTLYGAKIKLLENLSYISKGEIINNKLNVTLVPTLEEKFFVPINYSLKSKMEWFSGYCDADGCISRNNNNQSLQISSINKEFLINIKLMLQTCGVSSVVSLNMNERSVKLPKNDGSNESKEYKCKQLWRLLIASNQLQKLLSLGFLPKRLNIEVCNYQRSANKFISIQKIVDNNRIDKTYCFNEPKRHSGIFNGIITSQCTEIIEYSSPDETAVCNLASIALTNFVNETEANFSDNVIVYSKDNCNWCLLLKVLLKNKNVAFEEIVLTEENYVNELSKFGVQTVPQLIDNGKLIGGYDIVEKMLKSKFDYDKLHEVTKVVTENLNNVIDINFYPTEKTERSNLLHRPIGIGVQGLADVFLKMNLAFTSSEAREINQNIFETIYHASLEKSMELSKERKNNMLYLIQEYNYGNWTFKDSENKVCREYNVYNTTNASSLDIKKNDRKILDLLDKLKPIPNEIKNNEFSHHGSYSSYIGSPMHRGKLQFDLWDKKQSDRYNWNILRENITLFGVRNSLLVAPMPTASTSQILGNNECFEPFTSNVYSRRTLAGEFVIANKYLIQELIDLKMWNSDIKNNIIANRGSVQGLADLPKLLKEKYKVVWEMSMKDLIDMAEERGKYICQSQSLNLFVEDPDSKILTNMHFYSWNKGLKTGMYYLRRKAKHQAQQFTVNAVLKKEDKEDTECLMCSG